MIARCRWHDGSSPGGAGPARPRLRQAADHERRARRRRGRQVAHARSSSGWRRCRAPLGTTVAAEPRNGTVVGVIDLTGAGVTGDGYNTADVFSDHPDRRRPAESRARLRRPDPRHDHRPEAARGGEDLGGRRLIAAMLLHLRRHRAARVPLQPRVARDRRRHHHVPARTRHGAEPRRRRARPAGQRPRRDLGHAARRTAHAQPRRYGRPDHLLVQLLVDAGGLHRGDDPRGRRDQHPHLPADRAA